ncbi:FAD-dependent oxidoreductase [Glaciibacter flavus]|uniref:FAD-dependent oxidoreductase n=1 Tax=Orlajensenia flava TaxID=2565934 RepID=A0A4S4FU85_9MICO|nr:FAD-dependent oxidoreductase [Glaciibacter flavus]THG33994.1 FAD-dependent oxidoreductase [Glaciibacter flavus]
MICTQVRPADLTEEPVLHPVNVEVDVAVIGGGLAGVAAAIAAARRGATVALVGNRPVLGGNSSSEVRVWVCGATAHDAQKYARETGIMGELFLENQYRNPEGNPYFWDQVVLDAVRAEPGIRLFLNTDVRDVEASGPEHARHISAVTGWQLGTEKSFRFTAAMFLDCTGDGTVGALAGARYREGREARSEFGEEWAPEVADGDMLGSTLLFYTKNTGAPVRYVPPSIAKDISATPILAHRRIQATDNGCDYWWIEWGGTLDAVAANEEIRDELWAVIYGIWDHIKNSGEYDAETLTLEWVGSVPGKREYRRFIGDHTLTQHDIMAQTRFDDAIGIGGWSIDLHPPGGMYATEPGSKHLHTSGVYHIPFRSLYSVNVENLLFAGRDISATHVAFGTIRVMGTCAVTGEAAGAGAALAALAGITPRTLATDRLDELRRSLLRGDAAMLGIEWDDPRDLALTARVTASSTLESLDTEPAEDAILLDLSGRDLGIHLPIDPQLDAVEVLLESDSTTEIDIELWSTGRGENHIPVCHLDTVRVAIPHGREWARAEFTHAPEASEDVVVVIRRRAGVSAVVSDTRAPYGVLGLLSRAPHFTAPQNEAYPQTNAWSAVELRRKSVAVRVEPDTQAYRPSMTVGGYARPFRGPQLWSSAPLHGDDSEHIELRWDQPQRVGGIELIFNDDVDEDLINLHHHRTPFEVMPELVRDYRLQYESDSGWVDVVVDSGNRRRLRRHTLKVPVETSALRLVVDATNGDEHAMVHGVRVFAPEHAGSIVS